VKGLIGNIFNEGKVKFQAERKGLKLRRDTESGKINV
jgi:hypothetical protein